MVTGLVLENPAPLRASEHPELRPIENGIEYGNGIEVGAGGKAFRLMNAGATNVTFSVGAQGSMGARYVDPNTGYVTINSVYAE
jgi:hypothetical protein